MMGDENAYSENKMSINAYIEILLDEETSE